MLVRGRNAGRRWHHGRGDDRGHGGGDDDGVERDCVADPDPGGDGLAGPGRHTGTDIPRRGLHGLGQQPGLLRGCRRDLPFDVYCAVTPSGWSIASGSYDGADGGFMQVLYKYSTNTGFVLREGAWCPPR